MTMSERQPATTPSQTVGPFLAIGLPWADGSDLVAEGIPGALLIEGVVTDGAGEPVPDALIELWQADPDGRCPHPDDPRGASAYAGFRNFGRCPSDAAGHFWFRTLAPGADERDPVLATLSAGERAQLIGVPTDDGLRFDICLQGAAETPFFTL